MDDCGYITPDGVCVEPVLPIGTFTPAPTAPVDELAATGMSDPLFIIALVAMVLFGVGMALLWCGRSAPTVSEHD